jgi:hypothetical protein
MFRTRIIFLTSLCLATFLAADGPARGEDAKAIQPFNGKDLQGWKLKGSTGGKWVVGHAALDPKDPAKLTVLSEGEGQGAVQLVNVSSSVDLYTEEKFGDCTIELEFMVPKGSNSGIYVMGEYEVQVLDSFGKDKVGPGDLGGIYATAAPRVNASKKPGEWQKFVIDFQAPRFEAGKKTANARFLKVTLNGEVIHEGVEVKGPTPSCLTNKESPTGPVMFQGDHGPVAFRNIKIIPRASK